MRAQLPPGGTTDPLKCCFPVSGDSRNDDDTTRTEFDCSILPATCVWRTDRRTSDSAQHRCGNGLGHLYGGLALALVRSAEAHRRRVGRRSHLMVRRSADLLNGGPPYRGAQIDASQLTVLLGHLNDDGLFDIDDLTHARFGPDSEFTTILLKLSGKQLEMRSWHELVEDGRRGIARKIGVVANERPRYQVLEEEPQDYLFYRFVWAEIRARALALIPTSGDLLEGEVIMKSRNLSWQERQQ